MADVMIFAMVIASAVTLLIVRPSEAQRRALRALQCPRQDQSCTTNGRGEDLATPASDLAESPVTAVPCPVKAGYDFK